MLQPLLTVREVAAQLGVSTATVYALCERGAITHARVSNAIRIAATDLAAFVEWSKAPARIAAWFIVHREEFMMKTSAPKAALDGFPMNTALDGEDRLVGRTEAASLLGASVSTLRRLEQTTLRPLVDERGVHLHSVKRVLEYKVQHLVPKADDEGNGDVAAAAFDQFDSGLDAADVVKQLKITPALARSLQRDWADLRGSFVVGGLAAARLERFAATLEGSEIKTGDDIVRLISEIERTECVTTGRRGYQFQRYRRSPGPENESAVSRLDRVAAQVSAGAGRVKGKAA